MSILDTEAAICCMLVTNPGGGQRPHAWQQRVNDLIRAQKAQIAKMNAVLGWAQGCVPFPSDCHAAITAVRTDLPIDADLVREILRELTEKLMAAKGGSE